MKTFVKKFFERNVWLSGKLFQLFGIIATFGALPLSPIIPEDDRTLFNTSENNRANPPIFLFIPINIIDILKKTAGLRPKSC